jgi:hypothetical protein
MLDAIVASGVHMINIAGKNDPNKMARLNPKSIQHVTLVGHDPDGHIHTHRIALSPKGVKVVWIVALPLPAV